MQNDRNFQCTELGKTELLELAEQRARLLEAKGRSANYVGECRNHLRIILELTGYRLTEDAVVMALGTFRTSTGKSARTCNKYLRTLKSFTRWLARPGKRLLDFDPLVEVEMMNAKKDRRHERTPLSDDSLGRLLRAARSSARLYRGICGVDRAELYHAAAATGIREETLGLLEVGQFNLDPKAPVGWVAVRADQIKDDEDLTVPIQAASAAQLRRYFAGKMPTALAFRTPVHRWDYVRMLRRDLRDAGIPYCRRLKLDNGREKRLEVHDFHSLRHTYGTWLAKNNVPLTTAQRWMGHSTPDLTANIYSHVLSPDAVAAMMRMPALPGVVQAG